MSSAKCRSFCFGLSVFTSCPLYGDITNLLGGYLPQRPQRQMGFNFPGPCSNLTVLRSEQAWANSEGYFTACLIIPGVRTVETRTTRTPAFWGYPPPPHDYPFNWVILDPKSKDDKVKVTNFKNSPKLQIFEFWNGHYTRHTFGKSFIRCANIKWIQWVLLKIQSGHDSVHRRTDGQGDTSIPPYQLRWSGGYNDDIGCTRATLCIKTINFIKAYMDL